ncbi:uncharacterized protein LOC130949221 [Arachis stenosperma]|uniref:uncharacterized protein LOC130949221 n=1 Tax=Arachis stenosperma TaxID=217475 RepID=UPI0025AB9745|nr:uncharacterized protein LOC130949221 [Arachis stenosperma]
MEGTANLVVYRNSEIIHNTHEGVRFVSQNSFLFVVPCTMMLMELQNGLCQSMENGTLMKVSRILYRNPVVVFGGLIQFDIMPVTDEASMQNIFQIHRQTQMRHPQIELYVEFEAVEAVAVQNDINIDDDRAAVYEGMNSGSEEDFEATYEAGDKDEDGDVGVEAVAENIVVHPSSSQPMYVPPFMRVADPEDGEFRIGMEYSSRKSVVAVIRSFTISRGIDYDVYESEPQTFYAKCKMYGHGCDWLIRASLIRKKVAEAIRPLVETDPSIKVKYIIAEVQSSFNYSISYRKAWLAKQKSIAKVFGGYEDSYLALPWWLSVMVQKMPGSVVQIETRPLHCKSLVQVDGTHLYRKYKGRLLVAVSQYGNQNIVPIAFALVEGETADAWHFFLRNLRMYVVRKDGVGMISDRHESIRAAVNRSGYSRTVEEYNINYKRLEERGEAYARWCDALGLRHWVLAFDEGHRWGHLTTNLVECINSVLKGARNLPVLALVQATYYRLNELFTWKSAETHERKRAGFTYSVFAQQRIEANMQQAGNIVVHHFDRRNEVFEVREMTTGKVLVVDLARRTCDCGHFQVERIPCRHVIACCANQRLDWQLYVHDVYKMTEVRKVYRFEFTPLGDPETWPTYEGPTLVVSPAMRRTSKGRPKLTQYLNEMDSRDMRGPRICRLYGDQGHSRSKCPQRDGPSGACS